MMIELTIYNYLKTALSVPVYMEMPTTHTEQKFIIVQRTNGGEKNHIKSATIALQSYAASLYDAAELNETVKTAMSGITASVSNISKSELNSDYNFTARGSKLNVNDYRYQAIYNLIYTED